MTSRILAIGGGGFLMEESPSPIDRYLVQLLDRDRPKICFVATPSGDSAEMIDKFYATFEPFNCDLAHLAFFRKPVRGSLPLASFGTALLDQDAVFVGGGTRSPRLRCGANGSSMTFSGRLGVAVSEVVRGISGPLVAIDDGAAILYAGTELDEALRWRSDADAYRIFIDGGAVVEESIAARSIA